MNHLQKFDDLVKRLKLHSPVDKLARFAHNKPLQLVVSTGIHGNEQTNIDAMLQIMEEEHVALNSAPYSTVFLIGNPRAVSQNVRYSEFDMNRVFGRHGTTYEHTRSKNIVSAVADASYALDLHHTIEATRKPFGIFPNSDELLEFFSQVADFGDVVVTESGAQGDVTSFDEHLHTTYGIKAITVETGAIKGDYRTNLSVARNLILRSLRYTGVLFGEEALQQNSLQLWKQVSGIENKPDTRLVGGLENFMEVKAGEIIAKNATSAIIAPTSGILLFPKYVTTTDKYLVRIADKC